MNRVWLSVPAHDDMTSSFKRHNVVLSQNEDPRVVPP